MNELAKFQFEMNPFEWEPSYVSRIGGLGGEQHGPDDAYAFKTAPLIAPAGNVTFTVAFEGLQASKGVLLIEVSGGQESMRRQLRLRTVALAELAAAGGVEHITLASDQRDTYAVAGFIYDDTDAVARGLSVKIEVNVLAAVNENGGSHSAMKRVTRLAGLELPSFEHPTSQTSSKEQISSKTFSSVCKKIGVDASPASWSVAYVYQAIRYLLGSVSGLRGFGSGLSAELISKTFNAELAEVVGHDGLDPAYWPPAENLDFAWLIFEVPIIPAGHLYWMITLLIDRLKPGGALAVVFTFEHGRMPHEQCDVLKQGDVEIFALRLLAQGHSIAQLKFRAALRPLPSGTRTPFGLMIQRAA